MTLNEWNMNRPATYPPPEILYENGPVIIALKPPGLLTQSPPGIDSLEDRVKEYVRRRLGRTTGKVYLGVPHRLDRPASGVMVFARNVRAARRLSEQFEARQVEKTYWALVEGRIEEDEATWIDYLRKIPGQAHAEVADRDFPGGRKAVLRYRVKGRYGWGAWLKIELETGRTHQIRVQCASRGHPVLGDIQYGSTVPFGPRHDDPRSRAIALHARSLKLLHPKDWDSIEVVAPVSNTWGEWIGTEESRADEEQADGQC